MRKTTICLAAGAALLSVPALGDAAPFELTGPDLRVAVTRGNVTLPIAQVPSLAEGDTVTVSGAFPKDQGAQFLLMSAFLRGATNPPPKDWLSFAETWKGKDKENTLNLMVPKGARQMVVLLVPQTGGAKGALSDAVRGKPGEFVRASQELNQASLDHSRLATFLAAIGAQGDTRPEALRSVAPTLARSLSIKLQEDCLSKVIEQQASCLVQNKDALVLSDLHSNSLADTLTGTPTDLAIQLSYTREAGAGYYSSYIAVARDVAKIFGAFNNPQFNYQPALTMRKGDVLSLLLNAAPSFAKPKSVMLAALPAVEDDKLPRLRSTASGPICAARPRVVLPVEGAPLVFSTDFAHAMKARLTSASGQTVEVPVTAQAEQGGYVLSAGAVPGGFTGAITARLQGQWGFVSFDGPEFHLEQPDTNGWKVADGGGSLVVGRDNAVTLEGVAPSCIDGVALRLADGSPQPVKFTAQSGGKLSVLLPLDGVAPGELTVEIRQIGSEPVLVRMKAHVQASRLDGLEIHAGDDRGVLTGQRLDQVRSVTMDGLDFAPAGLTRDGKVDHLQLQASAGGRAAAKDTATKAIVALQDGRTVSMTVHIAPARPVVQVLNRTVYPAAPAPDIRQLDIKPGDLLPNTADLVFSVKAAAGAPLQASDAIEIVATDDGPTLARLTSGHGLTLSGTDVAVATLKASDLPAGTHGPLRFRLVRETAGAGDWVPLTTVARLPQITGVTCAKAGDTCTVTGRDLFLIEAVATDPAFRKGHAVQAGFTGAAITIPGPPTNGKLYVHLRDAPQEALALSVR
ncbi:hypothetical protein [Novosphingobium sp. Leaf2]|uniref:hypothetical protein n=1 Tax=Novosphingobium sp. Leaf2 TaxID=1735670 RepID=UPI0006FDC90B|nr:hypothetical protein [Novosphingobium sp. Leaf2]KQM21027.1 hypothetical protein ASE49_15145 [Novosphingobium sp. Leaf2]